MWKLSKAKTLDKNGSKTSDFLLKGRIFLLLSMQNSLLGQFPPLYFPWHFKWSGPQLTGHSSGQGSVVSALEDSILKKETHQIWFKVKKAEKNNLTKFFYRHKIIWVKLLGLLAKICKKASRLFGISDDPMTPN